MTLDKLRSVAEAHSIGAGQYPWSEQVPPQTVLRLLNIIEFLKSEAFAARKVALHCKCNEPECLKRKAELEEARAKRQALDSFA